MTCFIIITHGLLDINMIYPEKELSTQQPNHTTTRISQSKHLGVDLQQLVELVKHEVIGKDAEVYMNIILSRQGDLQATAKIPHIWQNRQKQA